MTGLGVTGARGGGLLDVSEALLTTGARGVEARGVEARGVGAAGADLSIVGIKCGGIVADLVVVNPAVRRRSLAFIRPPRLPDPSCN